ncbi:MAG: hypothetical protein KGH58_03485 [Candidatus Micrarchaeota archaeon]|nr:hypothetical protein [Candidatus Micrarchaeota archaeon]
MDQAKAELELLNTIAAEQALGRAKRSEESKLLKSISQKAQLIKSNPMYGDNVPKRLIPSGLNVTNLFRVELAGYWRMLYTLRGNETEIVVLVLYLLDHKRYDKLFGYRGA